MSETATTPSGPHSAHGMTDLVSGGLVIGFVDDP